MNYTTILFGQGFFEGESVINYCSRQIVMNDEIVVNFDPKPCINKTNVCRLTLRAKTENIVRFPTNYKACCLRMKYCQACISPQR